MLFSPIGEEFLYRGIVHGSFVSRFGEWRASVFDSLAFALTHVAQLVLSIFWGIGSFYLFQLPFGFYQCFLLARSFFDANYFVIQFGEPFLHMPDLTSQ